MNVPTRVMIVDDEPIQRTGFLHLCDWKEHGIDIVAQASNGQEALSLIEKTRPHVVITDIMMPVMDGIEFAQHMRKKYPEIKLVVLSSYSEFDYVREVFKYGVTDYLLKPRISAEEIISLIQSLRGDMNQEEPDGKEWRKDRSLLLAQLLCHEEIHGEEAWREAESRFPHQRWMFMLASTDAVLNRTQISQNELEQTFMEQAGRLLNGINHTCVFLKNECMVLFNYEPSREERVMQAGRQFAERMQVLLEFIRFVRSEAFGSIRLLKNRYQHAVQGLAKLVYFPGQALVSEKDIVFNTESGGFDHTQFAAYLRSLEVNKAWEHLKALLQKVRRTQALDEYALKRFCQSMIYTVISTLEPLKLPLCGQSASSRLKWFKKIDLAFDIDELEQILTQFFAQLEEDIRTHANREQDWILSRICQYVQENYADDLTLSKLADHLHLNYSYLSSYFKQRTNENLTTYINRVRTEKAKELLGNPHLSIAEVSRMAGYSEHNYFSKVFKKMTGLTPNEYRNRIFR